MGAIWYVKKEDIGCGIDSVHRFCSMHNIDIMVTEDPAIDWLPEADWKTIEEALREKMPIFLITERDLGTENGRKKILFIR